MRLSVVIPTHNKARYLNLTLQSFVHQRCLDFEVVVVDDASDDRTPEVVSSFEGALNLQYIRLERNCRSAARNGGLKAARGEVVLFNDDDRLAPPSFVEAHLRHFETRANLLITGPKPSVLSFWTPELPPNEISAMRARNALLHEHLNRAEPHPVLAREQLSDFRSVERLSAPSPWWDSLCEPVVQSGDQRIMWYVAYGGNISMLRSAAEAVSGWDEAFSGWGVEDSDFVYRVWKNGAKVIVDDQVLSYHQIHPTSAARFGLGRNNLLYFFSKFPGLEITLFGRWLHGRLSASQAQGILDLVHGPAGAQLEPLVRELVESHRDWIEAKL